jgi:very-short-patch-repair endonuclease
MSKSELEELLAFQIRAAGLPEPEREFRFDKVRLFRADFAWPDHRLLVEVEGGIWMSKGGHNTGRGILRDIEKGNLAASNNWLYLRFAPEHINSGQALDVIEDVLAPPKTQLQPSRKVAELLFVSERTVSRWAIAFGGSLSETASRKGRKRFFTPADIAQLQKAQSLLDGGLSIEAAAGMLSLSV